MNKFAYESYAYMIYVNYKFPMSVLYIIIAAICTYCTWWMIHTVGYSDKIFFSKIAMHPTFLYRQINFMNIFEKLFLYFEQFVPKIWKSADLKKVNILCDKIRPPPKKKMKNTYRVEWQRFVECRFYQFLIFNFFGSIFSSPRYIHIFKSTENTRFILYQCDLVNKQNRLSGYFSIFFTRTQIFRKKSLKT
jgi:hypothetical protein